LISPIDLPSSSEQIPVGAGELRPLARSALTVWTVRNGIIALLFILSAIVYDVSGIFAAERGLPVGAATAAVLIIGVAYSFLLPRLRYRFWRFALREEELLLEHGIFNRIRTVVPLRRIQHLDVSQNILEREYGVGKLIVHTAGTRGNTVIVPGLDFEEAERLRDAIRRYVLEDTL
jgi:uncharacterized protein